MEDDNEDGNGVIEEDYYAFLNVPRDAPNDEINNAYRRLSRIYHPDKHLDPLQKKEAEILFNKTKKAYEILSDPHKRAIYDSLGTRGLETEGWEIVQRTKTPQEIREEYERLARERDERRLQQRTNPRGNVTVNINATDLFSQYDEDDEYDYGVIDRSPFPIIEISAMSLTQSVEAPLTLRDTLMMGGYLNTHNGTGSGAVTVSAKRFLSDKGWVQVDFSAGNGPVLSMKGFRTLTKRIFGTAEFQLQFGPNSVRTGVETTLAMQLDKHTMGYLTWRGGLTSAMSTSIARDTESSHFGASLLLGIPHSFVSVNYTHKMKEQELKLRGALKAGTFGAVFEYSAEKKVSEHTSMSAGVSVGVPTGVSLKIKVTRASQSYIFPIHLCEEVMPSPIFYATVTPVILYAILKKLVIDPITAEQKERNKEKQREANKNRMAEKIREATAAVSLMSATFARIRSDEETRKGLVIVKALYGRIVSVSAGDSSETGNKDEIIDVTIPLQCLVKDSKLVLHEASKSQLPGFFDPCVGEDKVLYVQYLFHNHLHETTVGDSEALRIPKQSHRVNPT